MNSVDMFKAIGEDTRLRILRVMVDAAVEICACEIIDALGKPQYTISKGLSVLVGAGLVSERREGRQMMYTLVRSPLNIRVFHVVAALPAKKGTDLASDGQRLKVRLSKRVNGACVSSC